MKLNVPETWVEQSEAFPAQKFGIGNVAVILSLLRSKMYSDPIRAIVQEICSNARDAHREIGKESEPIQIHLPNRMDPTFKVRDFGPGITPDRMANVFIRYGNSTKRNDNHQTGGFGLGAKSPWAYNDTFGVISITPEAHFEKDGQLYENCLVKRQYVCLIDPSQEGELLLTGEEVTKDPQGTEVVIAVRPDDFSKFGKWVRDRLGHWEPKPKIGGQNLDWPEFDIQFKGEQGDWFLLRYGTTHDQDDGKPMALVDGVPYRLNYHSIFSGNGQKEERIAKLFEYPFRLVLKTGDVDLNAPREDLDYSKRTVDMLKKLFTKAMKELADLLAQEVASAKTLWEAQCLWRELKQKYNQIQDTVQWHGIKVEAEGITLRATGVALYNFEKRSSGSITRRSAFTVYYAKNSNVCVDDTGLKQPSKLRLATLFDQNPHLQNAQVIVFSDDPDPKVQQSIKEVKEWLEKDHNFSQLNPVFLSTIPKKKIVRAARSSTPVPPKAKVFRDSNKKSARWRADTNLDITKGGIFVEISGYKGYFADGSVVDLAQMADIAANLNLQVVGIPRRSVKKLDGQWIRLEDYIKAQINKLEADAELTAFSDDVQYREYTVTEKWSYLWQVIGKEDFLKLLKDKDGAAYRYLATCLKMEEIGTKAEKLAAFQKFLGIDAAESKTRKKSKLVKLHDDFVKNYPLMTILDDLEVRSLAMEELALYINAKDGK